HLNNWTANLQWQTLENRLVDAKAHPNHHHLPNQGHPRAWHHPPNLPLPPFVSSGRRGIVQELTILWSGARPTSPPALGYFQTYLKMQKKRVGKRSRLVNPRPSCCYLLSLLFSYMTRMQNTMGLLKVTLPFLTLQCSATF
ncbi:hypothetical protein BS17DRAFT_179239, partial [Gyrodon lividus]